MSSKDIDIGWTGVWKRSFTPILNDNTGYTRKGLHPGKKTRMLDLQTVGSIRKYRIPAEQTDNPQFQGDLKLTNN